MKNKILKFLEYLILKIFKKIISIHVERPNVRQICGLTNSCFNMRKTYSVVSLERSFRHSLLIFLMVISAAIIFSCAGSKAEKKNDSYEQAPNETDENEEINDNNGLTDIIEKKDDQDVQYDQKNLLSNDDDSSKENILNNEISQDDGYPKSEDIQAEDNKEVIATESNNKEDSKIDDKIVLQQQPVVERQNTIIAAADNPKDTENNKIAAVPEEPAIRLEPSQEKIVPEKQPAEDRVIADEKQPEADRIAVIEKLPEADRVTANEKPPETDRVTANEKPPEQERRTVVPYRDMPTIPPAIDDPSSQPMNIYVPQNKNEITFSRIVRATVGQIIEIPFYGNGWVFLGELTSKRGIVYNSRRLDTQGQSFVFRAEEAGTYALKFFRQDFIRDYILNDYVQVVIADPPDMRAGLFSPVIDRGRVTAEPRWPSALDENAAQRGRTQGNTQVIDNPEKNETSSSKINNDILNNETASSTVDKNQTGANTNRPADETASRTQQPIPLNENNAPAGNQAIQRPENLQTENMSASGGTQSTAAEKSANTEVMRPDELLKKAKETFDSGSISAALALLDQYSDYFPGGSDELFWLYGQLYEANTPSRNIKLSLDYYRRLVQEYPQSSRYDDGRKRIAYIERYYMYNY